MNKDPGQKTVLHLITGLEAGGGAETMLARTVPHLTKTEPVVCSMIPHGTNARKLERNGVEVHSLNMQSKLDLRGIWRYRQLVKQIQPDIQVNYLIHADVFGRIFGSLFGVEHLISFIRNRHEEALYMLAERMTLPLVDGLATNSPATLQFYREHYDLPDRQDVLPNGVEIPDDESIDTSGFYEELSVDRETSILTCVARLHPQKDHDTLFHAVRELQRDTPDTTLLLCGEGPRMRGLKQKAAELGIEDHVCFLGHREDVNAVLKMTDVFVLPSRFEGMSNALLEAMAMARACLVSDIPENTELIHDGENGLVFEVGNPHDCYEKIKWLLERDDRREELGQHALKTVQQQYTVEAERERLDDFLASI